MNSVGERIRRMLAKDLHIEEQALTSDYCWLDAMGSEDAPYFLAKVNNAFRNLPESFSFGEGDPFAYIDRLERISTVGGLIEHVERHRGAWLLISIRLLASASRSQSRFGPRSTHICQKRADMGHPGPSPGLRF